MKLFAILLAGSIFFGAKYKARNKKLLSEELNQLKFIKIISLVMATGVLVLVIFELFIKFQISTLNKMSITEIDFPGLVLESDASKSHFVDNLKKCSFLKQTGRARNIRQIKIYVDNSLYMTLDLQKVENSKTINIQIFNSYSMFASCALDNISGFYTQN